MEMDGWDPLVACSLLSKQQIDEAVRRADEFRESLITKKPDNIFASPRLKQSLTRH
jgi:hypothetical protein